MAPKSDIRFLIAALCLAMAASLSGCAARPATDDGTRTESDPGELRRLAQHGDTVGANNLGMLYATGVKVPQDFAEARKWYVFASEHGNPAGEYNLGIAYERGQGTAVDLPEALKWLGLASDHNYPPAQFALALMYSAGIGVPRDEIEATRLARAAALQGLPTAQGMMAALYADGTGVTADDSLAYQWASLATAKLTGAPAGVANKIREEAAKGLSPAELTQAQAATTNWKPGTELVSVLPPRSGPLPLKLRGTGSGFVVGKDGEIATDFHVVPNCREIRLADAAGAFKGVAQVVAEDRANDLALLTGGKFGGRLKLRTQPAELGETITSFGFPLATVLGGSGNLTGGFVSGSTGLGGSDKSFQITAPVQIGSSGGPIADPAGAVIGIVAAKLDALAVAASLGDLVQNVNFAWRTDALKALMDQRKIAYERTGKAPPRTGVDLAALLQKATVRIECWR